MSIPMESLICLRIKVDSGNPKWRIRHKMPTYVRYLLFVYSARHEVMNLGKLWAILETNNLQKTNLITKWDLFYSQIAHFRFAM